MGVRRISGAIAVGVAIAVAAAGGAGAVAQVDPGAPSPAADLTPTSLALASTPNPPVAGSISFTATVTPADATGTVRFLVDAQELDAAIPVVGGVATSTTTTDLRIGEHIIQANYSGDGTYASSVRVEVIHVTKATPTVTVSTASGSLAGEDFTFAASVAGAEPTGTVQFSVDGTALGTPVALTSGAATSTPIALGAGDHAVTASYSGDDRNEATTSPSHPVDLPWRATTITLTPDPTTPIPDEMFEVRVGLDPAPPDGNLEVNIDGTLQPGPPIPVEGRSSITIWVPGQRRSVAVEVAFGDSASFTDTRTTIEVPIGFDASRYLEAAYPAVLGRPADPSGTAFWLARLGSDPTLDTIRSFSRAFATTAREARLQTIRQAYERALQRPADPAGLAYWEPRLRRGDAAETLLADLASSPEGLRRAGSSPDERARALYRLHLGRDGSASERAAWARRLAAEPGAAGVRRAAVTIGRSDEATRRAIDAAALRACGPVAVSPTDRAELAAAWPAGGRTPGHLTALALAVVCAPAAVGS